LIPVLFKFAVFLRVNKKTDQAARSVDYFSSFRGANKPAFDSIIPPPRAYSLEMDRARIQQEASPIVAEVDCRVEQLRRLFSLFDDFTSLIFNLSKRS
jgi:hypothetical protein